MLKNKKRFAAMILTVLTATALMVPTAAIGVRENTLELDKVTVKTLGEVGFENDSAAIPGERYNFSLKLEEDWVLRGIEIFDGAKNPIDFDITGIYRYSFVLPKDGATILTRSEDHGIATRAECVKSLWELAGSPIVDYLTLFTDIDPEADYAEAIRWAASEKLVTDGAKFRPEDEITREELAVVIYRLAEKLGLESESEICVLPDSVDRASVSDWAADAVCWNVTNGVMDEYSGAAGYFLPQESITRSELDDAIGALIGLTEEGEESESESEAKEAGEADFAEDEGIGSDSDAALVKVPSKCPSIKLGWLCGRG